MSGHFWTVWPLVRKRLRPPAPPPEKDWRLDIEDPATGPVRLRGRLSSASGRSHLVVLVHGLGGSMESSYVLRAARAADAFGVASLRLNLRGADMSGQDFYHAGLSSDIAAVLTSPALARFERIDLMGASLGGHLCLRYATATVDPRLGAVAAVCPPLDLERSVRYIDRPAGWAYRRFILSNLVTMSEPLVARERSPATLARLRRVRSIREWDRLMIVPRFGFASTGDYYRRAGVGGRLGRLRRPALIVAAERDPLLPPAAVKPGLTGAGEKVRAVWVRRGGHIGFPAALDLGHDGPLGLAGQCLAWLLAQN